jgi:2-polyprenyl-6-methoxyphenol hydroxylase-like FAD-dependent oxidoreductase
MPPLPEYDLVTVGGGLAGAALARTMARRGARVLVVERETKFRDRVRGEGMLPWGVREAKRLDLKEILVERCGHEVYQWTYHVSGRQLPPRDFHTTTPEGDPCLDFYHPEMQEVVLAAAAGAGAEVLRGAIAAGVISGRPATVILMHGATSVHVRAHLVVGADGRNSQVRGWAGFRTHHDPERLVVGGVLFADVNVPSNSVHSLVRPGLGDAALYFPLGSRRARVYYVYRRDGHRRRLSGRQDQPAFLDAVVAVGIPRDWLEAATFAGPLAIFEGAASWVDSPYSNGVALIGDAAASSDPTFGQGLSLTLMDVRLLSDALIAETDWNKAGFSYAMAHDRAYTAIHTIEQWMTDLFLEIGEEADQRRARAFPPLAQDPTRRPDYLGLGPETPHDDDARKRLFGET